MALIRAENVALGYEGKIINRGIRFTVEAGDYLCIIGENGCGKTTLMKVLTNNKSPMEGEISMGENMEKGKVGYLPQGKKDRRDFPASVMEVVLSGCLGAKGRSPFYNRRDRKMAVKSMERMGIESLAKYRFAELSGGQQQRALLARALCGDKSLLLLDEPTAGLDPKATAEIYKYLSALHRDGMTIVMISHDMEATEKYATHILRMDTEPVFFGDRKTYENAFPERGEADA